MDEKMLKELQHIFGPDQVYVVDEGSFPEEDASAEAEEEYVHRALMQIVLHRDQKAVNWAVNYARAGLGMSGKDLKTQVLYVLNNIQHWRGPVASDVRATLKRYVGVK